jgi:hypothetical protein
VSQCLDSLNRKVFNAGYWLSVAGFWKARCTAQYPHRKECPFPIVPKDWTLGVHGTTGDHLGRCPYKVILKPRFLLLGPLVLCDGLCPPKRYAKV